MTPETVLTLFQQALEVMVALILVLLIPALLVGLLVAMFQAATQINEMTLSFIPKILVTLAVLMIAGPWMLQLLLDYTRRLVGSIPSLLG
ncbi:MAG: flagellar biosynthetic protein FliQ [Gammaproteobacteria bacterium HGW-Gammaproteobacteria-1]|jgi:flagellar biosynthetic protein FliQ|nr:MAG: flagellar biosynthetic protein FliQ [Gammaproteobacteria bacterium HGW-Gammaproteobacteria-1]